MVFLSFQKNWLRLWLTTYLFVGVAAQAQQKTFEDVRIPGSASGLSPKNNDDILDAALVFPSLRSSDLIKFQLGSLIGPKEILRAGPQNVLVPGNLYVPEQKERYGLLPITLEKNTFGFYVTPNRNEELFATWIQAPFKLLVEVGQGQANFDKLLPLLKMRAYAFESDRDWRQAGTVQIKINQAYESALSYTWTRPNAPQGSLDMALNFQSTPARRWIMTDFLGKAPSVGKLARIKELGSDFKVLFLRLQNDAAGKILSAKGWIRSANSIETSLKIEGLASDIAEASVSGTRVQWKPITTPGWAVLVRRSAEVRSTSEDSNELPSGLKSVAEVMNSLRNKVQEIWLDPSKGTFELPTRLNAEETLTLIFVGTDRVVPRPDTDTREEAAIFTFANEFRMISLQ